VYKHYEYYHKRPPGLFAAILQQYCIVHRPRQTPPYRERVAINSNGSERVPNPLRTIAYFSIFPMARAVERLAAVAHNEADELSGVRSAYIQVAPGMRDENILEDGEKLGKALHTDLWSEVTQSYHSIASTIISLASEGMTYISPDLRYPYVRNGATNAFIGASDRVFRRIMMYNNDELFDGIPEMWKEPDGELLGKQRIKEKDRHKFFWPKMVRMGGEIAWTARTYDTWRVKQIKQKGRQWLQEEADTGVDPRFGYDTGSIMVTLS
jgi:hypothetical protein